MTATSLEPMAFESVEQVDLQVCRDLLARHLTAVERVFGAPGLGVIDIPTMGTNSIVAEHVQVAAVLFWLREVDRSGLIQFVEELADRLATGRLHLGLGPKASQALGRFWRERSQRFDVGERRALFERIFGAASHAPGGGSGDSLLLDLARALAGIGRQALDHGISMLVARTQSVAAVLGRLLSDRAVGIAAFAARELVRQVGDSLTLLKNPDIERGLGGGTPWALLARHGDVLLGRNLEIHQALVRASSGFAVLRWLADAAPTLRAGRVPLDRDDAVVSAAESFLTTVGGA